MPYVLHSSATNPLFRDKYLGWVDARFVPVTYRRFAKVYASRATAQAVATRYNREHRKEADGSPEFEVLEITG